VIFDKLIQVLVFGCGYRRIADASCSATTLRRRRDEWIASGLAEQLHQLALAAYDRLHGLEPEHLAIDGCITKAPGGGQVAGPSPVDRRKQGRKRSVACEAAGIPLAAVPAPANRRHDGLLAATLDTAAATLTAVQGPAGGCCPIRPRCTWTPATTTSPAGKRWPTAGCGVRSPRVGRQRRFRRAAAG
jgi:transposase